MSVYKIQVRIGGLEGSYSSSKLMAEYYAGEPASREGLGNKTLCRLGPSC
jgi:hypothetical protein